MAGRRKEEGGRLETQLYQMAAAFGCKQASLAPEVARDVSYSSPAKLEWQRCKQRSTVHWRRPKEAARPQWEGGQCAVHVLRTVELDGNVPAVPGRLWLKMRRHG